MFFANGVDWVIWWLAASRIGALAVPLSTLYAPAEIAKVVRLADVGLLIAPPRVLDIDVAERFEAALPELAAAHAHRLSACCCRRQPRRIVLTGDSDRQWSTRRNESDPVVSQDILAAVEAEVSPADLAVMVHTSGSTADLERCAAHPRHVGPAEFYVAGRDPCGH